jgi:hypothetical protein
MESIRGQRGLPGDANFQDITQEQLNGFVLGAFMKKRISNESFIKNITPNIVLMSGFGEEGTYKDGEIILEDSIGEVRTVNIIEKVNVTPTIEGQFQQGDTIEVYEAIRVIDIFGDGSCKAYYDFNNNIINRVTNNVATVEMGAVSYSNGMFSNTINFPSMPATIIADYSYAYLSGGSYSISFFLYFSPTIIQTTNILAGIGSVDIGFDSRPGYNNVFIVMNGGQYVMSDSNVFVNEGWYHIVVNTASTVANYSCYVNGVLMTAKNRINNFNTSPNTKLSIGGSSYYGSSYYNSRQKIDTLRAFNRHLTKEEAIILRDEYSSASGFFLYHNALSTVVSAKHQFRVLNFPLPHFSAKKDILNSGLKERDLYTLDGQLLVK